VTPVADEILHCHRAARYAWQTAAYRCHEWVEEQTTIAPSGIREVHLLSHTPTSERKSSPVLPRTLQSCAQCKRKAAFARLRAIGERRYAGDTSRAQRPGVLPATRHLITDNAGCRSRRCTSGRLQSRQPNNLDLRSAKSRGIRATDQKPPIADSTQSGPITEAPL